MEPRKSIFTVGVEWGERSLRGFLSKKTTPHELPGTTDTVKMLSTARSCRAYWMIGICDVLFRVMEFFGTNGIVIGNTYVICTTTKLLTMLDRKSVV